MTKDLQHQNLLFRPSEVTHLYGENVHILSDPYHLGILSKLCHPQTFQPWVNLYMEKIYSMLFSTMVNLCFPKAKVASDTRMKVFQPEGVYEGEVTSPDAKIVCVNLARAGTFPSHICYQTANFYFLPELVRQDHFYVNRKTNSKEEVIGVDMSGSKIGGDVKNCHVILPDPMGATGGTLSHVINHYKNQVDGVAKKYIALHLIVTPEYLKRMQKDHPDLTILALRLDRGLSSLKVLNSTPGTYWDEEKGLTGKQYIVPGGGGLGEVLNNAYV